MSTYRVVWEIEIDADSPRGAAEEALDCIVNGEARVFDVFNVNTGVKISTEDLYYYEEVSDE